MNNETRWELERQSILSAMRPAKTYTKVLVEIPIKLLEEQWTEMEGGVWIHNSLLDDFEEVDPDEPTGRCLGDLGWDL